MLNNLAKQINVRAREKGFWNSMDSAIDVLEDHASEYGVSKDTIKATKDAFIAQKIALVHGELSEAIEAMRNNMYGTEKKSTFEDEIGDAIMRLLDIAAQMDINIEAQIAWKMDYNLSRAQKHGKEF
jgi:NTP pyrophosphatase (non-canonical NTP hydrolase)